MVIDTNIALSCIVENDVSLSTLLIKNTLFAPNFAKVETLNILRKYHTLKHIPMPIVDNFYNDYINLIDVFVPDNDILHSAKTISFTINHPIYDCLFLALSQEYSLPFISADKKLVQKAVDIGIEGILY
jgi:predicted nucleic acid-binding protein